MQTDSWEIVAKDNWRALETFRAGTVHAAPPDDANLAERVHLDSVLQYYCSLFMKKKGACRMS